MLNSNWILRDETLTKSREIVSFIFLRKKAQLKLYITFKVRGTFACRQAMYRQVAAMTLLLARPFDICMSRIFLMIVFEFSWMMGDKCSRSPKLPVSLYVANSVRSEDFACGNENHYYYYYLLTRILEYGASSSELFFYSYNF